MCAEEEHRCFTLTLTHPLNAVELWKHTFERVACMRARSVVLRLFETFEFTGRSGTIWSGILVALQKEFAIDLGGAPDGPAAGCAVRRAGLIRGGAVSLRCTSLCLYPQWHNRLKN